LIRRTHQRGFTLLEVLVALAIASVAFIAALRAAGSMTNNAQDLSLRSLALWSAENRLSQIRISGEWPNSGQRQYDCSQADTKLVCTEEVFVTPNPFFRRVELSVSAQGSTRRSAKLTGFAVQN
jgi:general secretion pathway protein I